MRGQLAGVELERRDGVAVAILSGEIDMSNATSVRQEIAAFVVSNDDAVVIDLSDVGFIDSAGLHALVELGGVLSERRQQLLLCAPPDSQVARAIEIVGMQHTITVHGDRDVALQAARDSVPDSRPVAPPNQS
jgi:anti-sigma B factor antagonist